MGLKPMQMTTAVFTRMVYSMCVDELVSAFMTRYEAREKVDEWLHTFELPKRPGSKAVVKAPPKYDRETWGLLPEHQAGLRAAMGIFEGGVRV